MKKKEVILCSASNYTRKFYLNEEFVGLPKEIKDDLKIICVLFTEEVGGAIVMYFDDEGNLNLSTEAYEGDVYYDEIGSALKIKELQIKQRELFEQLEMFYTAFYCS